MVKPCVAYPPVKLLVNTQQSVGRNPCGQAASGHRGAKPVSLGGFRSSAGGQQYVRGVLSFVHFHPVPLGAHTSAPLLVSFKDNEAGIIAHLLTCLDFFVLDLERSSGYIYTVISHDPMVA
jgi:hypothetical protein